MIWIIGTGTIALEYAKILDQLEHEFIAVGRSGKNADEFIEAGAKEVVSGGLNNYLAASPTTPQKVIVATNVDQLAEVTVSLLNFGIKDILVEKPGFCRPEEITPVVQLAQAKNAHVLLAYNLTIPTTGRTLSGGMDIVICTTAQTDEEARELLTLVGAPFER